MFSMVFSYISCSYKRTFVFKMVSSSNMKNLRNDSARNLSSSCVNTQQDRQYTYNVTLRRVHDTTVVTEKQQVLFLRGCMRVCVRVPGSVGVCMRVRECSLTYPVCMAYGPTVSSFVAPIAPPYFWTLSHKRHDFRENVLHIKCVF